MTELYEYQKKIVDNEKKKSTALFMEPGCVMGNNYVWIKLNNRPAKRVTVEYVYNHKDEDITIKSLVNGRFAYMPVANVFYSGKKECVEIHYEGERSARYERLKCTHDHPVLTDKGWTEANKLTINSIVFTNGVELEKCVNCGAVGKKMTGKKSKVYKGHCLDCYYKIRNNRNLEIVKSMHKGYIVLRGAPLLKHPGYNPQRGIPEHIYIMEQKIQRKLKKEEVVHHLDFNRLNNDINNLYLCKNSTEHNKFHRETSIQNLPQNRDLDYITKKKGKVYFGVQKSKIKNIKQLGVYDTYDIEIDDNDIHNFVCSNVVVHNTGKTITSLALYEKSKQPKILVICVLSKLQDWQDDLKKEVNMDSIILNKGTTKNDEIITKNETNAFIINFESAWRCKELLNWVDKNTYILIDESHKMKSIKSKIGKFCSKLKNKTETKCILTGTPQSVGFIDYYNQLNFIDVLTVPFKMFSEAYCVYETQKYNGFPFKQLVGYKNTYTLEKIINDNCVFFKRDLDNDQIPVEVDIKLNKPKNYEAFKKVRIYNDYVADNVSKLFVTLRTMCSGNIGNYEIDNQKIKWLEDLCEDLSYRLVIFYNFNFEKDAIIKLLEKLKIPYSQYNGSVKDLTNFNKYDNGVAICQYMSASLGLNDFVKANICIMYSPSLNYTDYVQSKKRIDRIGQTKKPLFYNLYCKGTVEEKILQSIKKGITFDERMFEAYMKDDALPVKEVRK